MTAIRDDGRLRVYDCTITRRVYGAANERHAREMFLTALTLGGLRSQRVDVAEVSDD